MPSPSERRRFYVIVGNGRAVEVAKAEYVRVERAAGFRNTLGQPDEPATHSFSGTASGVPVRGYTNYGQPVEPAALALADALTTTTEDR